MNAREIRETAIESGPFSSLGAVVAFEANARQANGLPERDAELDGVRCPPELCIWLALAEDHPDRIRHDHGGKHLPNPWSAHGPVLVVAPPASQLLGELAGYRYPEPGESRPVDEREHDMDGSTATAAATTGEGRMVTAQTMERALYRATSDRAVTVDTFAGDQTATAQVLDLNPDDLALWLDSLTAAECRDTLGALDRIANEHRRRAESANILADRIREVFANSARYGQDVPMRG